MKIVTLGEVMLRLKSPGFERLFQSPALEATFGGAEANVAVSLAHACALTGMHLRIASPPGFELPASVVPASAEVARHGATLVLFLSVASMGAGWAA